MKKYRHRILLLQLRIGLVLFLGFLTFVLTRPAAWAAPPAKKTGITIKSKGGLEVDHKNKIATYFEAEAQQEDITLNCQRLVIYYGKQTAGEQPAEQPLGDQSLKIDKIIARGNVIIKRSDGSIATGDEAVYSPAEEKIVLSGDPTLKKGKEFIKATKFTFFLKEDRMVTEGPTTTNILR